MTTFTAPNLHICSRNPRPIKIDTLPDLGHGSLLAFKEWREKDHIIAKDEETGGAEEDKEDKKEAAKKSSACCCLGSCCCCCQRGAKVDMEGNEDVAVVVRPRKRIPDGEIMLDRNVYFDSGGLNRWKKGTVVRARPYVGSCVSWGIYLATGFWVLDLLFCIWNRCKKMCGFKVLPPDPKLSGVSQCKFNEQNLQLLYHGNFGSNCAIFPTV